MKLLVFDTVIHGHHLEYIHHIYQGMVNHPNDELLLVVPKDFEDIQNMYEWDESVCHEIVYLGSDEIASTKSSNILYSSLKRSLLLKKYINQYKPDRVILIMLMMFMPFLALFAPNKVKISGILYKIYLYRWKNMSYVRKCMEVGIFLLLKYCKSISTIFVLNDNSSVLYLNKIYKTDKFCFLPDPFNKISYNGRALRNDYHIKECENVFLHFGSLEERKGTLDILKAINIMTEEERRDKVFIFAGKVDVHIEDEFAYLFDKLSSSCKIIVEDKFCSNEHLVDLCLTCDVILMPYKFTDLSSGVLGYAAVYEKKVIGPSEGLLGKLIKRNKLGYVIDKVNASSIKNAIVDAKKDKCTSNYPQQINIGFFQKTIFKRITAQ